MYGNNEILINATRRAYKWLIVVGAAQVALRAALVWVKGVQTTPGLIDPQRSSGCHALAYHGEALRPRKNRPEPDKPASCSQATARTSDRASLESWIRAPARSRGWRATSTLGFHALFHRDDRCPPGGGGGVQRSGRPGRCLRRRAGGWLHDPDRRQHPVGLTHPDRRHLSGFTIPTGGSILSGFTIPTGGSILSGFTIPTGGSIRPVIVAPAGAVATADLDWRRAVLAGHPGVVGAGIAVKDVAVAGLGGALDNLGAALRAAGGTTQVIAAHQAAVEAFSGLAARAALMDRSACWLHHRPAAASGR